MVRAVRAVRAARAVRASVLAHPSLLSSEPTRGVTGESGCWPRDQRIGTSVTELQMLGKHAWTKKHFAVHLELNYNSASCCYWPDLATLRVGLQDSVGVLRRGCFSLCPVEWGALAGFETLTWLLLVGMMLVQMFGHLRTFPSSFPLEVQVSAACLLRVFTQPGVASELYE